MAFAIVIIPLVQICDISPCKREHRNVAIGLAKRPRSRDGISEFVTKKNKPRDGLYSSALGFHRKAVYDQDRQ